MLPTNTTSAWSVAGRQRLKEYLWVITGMIVLADCYHV